MNFGDMDVVFIGALVPKVGQKFDEFWNSIQVKLLENLESLPQQPKALSPSDDANILDKNYYSNLLNTGYLPFFWGKATLIADSPDKILKKQNVRKFIKQTQLFPYIAAAQQEILIFTPYLVPTQTGIQHLKELRNRGIRIILFTNSLATTDVPIVHSAYIRYRKKLLELGVELYELKQVPYLRTLFKQRSKGSTLLNIQKESLHAKIMVFDRKAFYIGSMNIDPRSVYENTELGLVIESEKIAQSIYTWFNKNIQKLAYKVELKQLGDWNNQVVWRQGKKDYLITEPNTSLFGRVWMNFLSSLPLAEDQL
jgi:putative cardiolipin synthase